MTFEYLRQSLFFFRNHLGMIARIQVPFLLLTSALSTMTMNIDVREMSPEQARTMMTMMMANVLLMPLYQGATIAYLGSVVNNTPYTVFQSISAAVGRWPRLFLVYLLTAVGVTFGLMLFILPGILIMVRLFFADYACVVEKRGIMESLTDSWHSTKAYFWPLVSGLGLMLSVLIGLRMLIDGLLFSGEDSLDPLIAVPVEILFALVGTSLTVYGFRIFCVMREAQNN